MEESKPKVRSFAMMKAFAVTAFVGVWMLTWGSMAIAQSTGNLSYKVKCEVCHGAKGLADTSPGKQFNMKPFTDSAVLAMSDATLQGFIINGSGKMPAYQGKLPDAEVTNLIQYIHNLQNGQ